MRLDFFDYTVIKPLEWFGIYYPYIALNLDTILFTWIGMIIIFGLILFSKKYLYKPESPVSLVFEQSVEMFHDLCIDTFGYFKYEYFAFVTSIFVFTLICNLVAFLPYIEEPTKDLHTTFALGIISYLYVQYQKIRVHGLGGYLKEYVQPIFIMLPLNIIGEIAKVLSMSFRLFGNILGGAIVLMMAIDSLAPYKKAFIFYTIITLLAYFIAQRFINFDENRLIKNIFNTALIIVFFISFAQAFFVIFEGFIQAFVITMLTMTYLALGASESEKEVKESV